MCARSYDLDCAAMSDKRFILMTKPNKQNWKCRNCISKKKKKENAESKKQTTSTPKAIMKQQNLSEIRTNVETSLNDSQTFVTVRKPLHFAYEDPTSLDGESLLNTNTSILRRSLPDLSTRDNEDIDELKNSISDLKIQLAAAHNEIENLMLEKNALEKKINGQEAKINHLLKICSISISKEAVEKVDSNNTEDHITFTESKNPWHSENIIHDSVPEEHSNAPINSTNSDTLENRSHISAATNNTIKIIGSQQCSGMAAYLKRSRENTVYEDYIVTATIKPDAPVEEILRDCHKDLKPSDVIVLGIGENDYNPLKFVSELYTVMQHLKNHVVFILEVQQNPYLNKYKLNHKLRWLSTQFQHCHFIENCSSFYNKCYKINNILDSNYYEKHFLDPKSWKARLHNVTTKVQEQRKRSGLNSERGKIPYYFKPKQDKCVDELPQSIKLIKPKQKNILDYFKVKEKTQTDTNPDTSLFRT